MSVVKGGDKFQAAMEELARKVNQPKTLQVGFFEGATNSKTGASIPMYAAVNNFGSSSRGIPPRPFFSNMVRDKSETWPAGIAEDLKATNYDVDATLDHTGQIIVGQLQDSINNGIYAPLKPATIRRKKFDKPLIDTADMLNAATFRIKST